MKAACAELSPRGASSQEFEVGVFCGTYVTPVDEGYFEHLDQVRGKAQEFKEKENVRAAVTNGVAGGQISQAALSRAHLNQDRSVTFGHEMKENGELTNGTSHRMDRKMDEDQIGSQGQNKDESQMVRDQMDISLHNFGDYSTAGDR